MTIEGLVSINQSDGALSMKYIALLTYCHVLIAVFAIQAIGQDLHRPADSIRVATYNVALNRRTAGALTEELESGQSKDAKALAKVLQIVRPDIVLLNEVDYDKGKSVNTFLNKYLAVGQDGNDPLEYQYHYTGPVNTGVDSGVDMDGNNRKGEPVDAFGFGRFPGQYGMAIFSKFEIDTSKVRTFQNFLWKDMPDALVPRAPKANKNYYSDEIMKIFRLSSKSHWDVPVKVGDRTIHVLASHPTPPVFDGEEDKNGCRNYDEIRMIADYVSGKGVYLYDDAGKKGAFAGEHFVIVGDLNSDPIDGNSRPGTMDLLLKNPMVNGSVAPKSTGGKYWSEEQGKVNLRHKGDPLNDTGDFGDDRAGNMRIDYALPSKSLKVVNSGVFWPKPGESGAEEVKVSDHRLVWIDVAK